MTRVAPIVRRTVVLLVVALTLLAAGNAWAVYYLPAAPRGSVGVSQPVIHQQFELGAGESIKSARLFLDGKRVEPTWDETGLVQYTPAAPLSVGAHSVRLIVEIDSGSDQFFYDPIVSDFTITVAQGAVSQLPVPGPEPMRALQWVNGYRQAAGLQPMVYNAALGAAAAGHARYLVANPSQQDVNAHGEVPGRSLFIGATAAERAQYFGYGGGTAEVINFTDRAEAAVDGWMETLYHRIALVHPGNRELGYGLAGSGQDLVNVLEAGPGRHVDGSVVVWPHDGQVNVPTGWDGLETPDPFRLYPGAARPVGYTITLTFGDLVQGLTLDSWSLTGPGGAVQAMEFSPANDNHLQDTVALIPTAPLARASRYTVTMAGRVDKGGGVEPYRKTWVFTTADEDVPNPRKVNATTRQGVLSRLTVNGTGFSSGLTAYLGGLPVRNLEVLSGERIAFDVPTGLPDGNLDLLLVTPGGRETLWSNIIEAGEMPLPQSGPAFTPMPVFVHGEELSAPALVHSDGALLLPERALTVLGAAKVTVPEIGRTYWTWAGRRGDYTQGRISASAAERAFSLTLPVQRINGQTYVDVAFFDRLLLEPVRIADGRIDLGVQDIAGHWARPQIAQLLRDGIVSGVGAGQFRPNDTLTRAAFVKMLVGARQLPPAPGDAGQFSDTAQHWVSAQGFIGAAVQAGVVVPSEYPGRQFQPDTPISREEMAVMVTRALGRDAEARSRTLTLSGAVATVAGRSFADAGTWTKAGYIAVAVEQGIITGYPEENGTYTYRPFRQATRAEAVVMIVRTMDK